MISDRQARQIASEWHGGQGSALYAFASTGAIDTAWEDHDIRQEIRPLREHSPNFTEYDRLTKLLKYCDFYGPRGPVDGWSDLHW
jgi:hypothetical protein